ncbi:LysR family transcriptional regulator [Vibrio mediterranei]|uniref:LysR family transcriptional regulator n=1 Tax=Vibrio mediterranei TaxID=689 RepID=UPI00148CD71E|nr:LysR family transcriptional regulator [Vibrio mediterranei]NOI26496.1 LysR family transcriptional regulator [Vibrio mediterranei]
MDKLNFDLRHLRAYISVVDNGSFSEAAKQLNLTQSAISQLIGHLEKNLNTELIDRKKRPVKVTITGRELYQFGHKLLSDSKQMQEKLYAIKQGKIPYLRLGLVDSIGQVLGVNLLTYLEPKINKISLTSGTALDLLTTLQMGDVDIILTMINDSTPDGVALFPLISESYLIVTPKTWQPQSLQDLCKKQDYIAYSGRTPTGFQTLNWLKWRNLKPNIQFELARADHVLHMIAAGHGWTLATPTFLAHNLTLIDNVCLHSLPEPGLSRNLAVICREGELENFILPFVADIKTMLSDRLSPHFKSNWSLCPA